jgi:hypothetical protein
VTPNKTTRTDSLKAFDKIGNLLIEPQPEVDWFFWTGPIVNL